MSDLAELLARVEAASGPDRELDADLMVALGGARRVDDFSFYGPNEAHWSFGENEDEDGAWSGPLPYLTASLDAALALVERVLPGEGWRLLYGAMMDWRAHVEPDMRGRLPLALLAALLKALIAKAEA